MDFTRWHLWHAPDGWWAQLKGSNGRVLEKLPTAAERAAWCEAQESEHPEKTQ